MAWTASDYFTMLHILSIFTAPARNKRLLKNLRLLEVQPLPVFCKINIFNLSMDNWAYTAMAEATQPINPKFIFLQGGYHLAYGDIFFLLRKLPLKSI